jgi:hypothetical protein
MPSLRHIRPRRHHRHTRIPLLLLLLRMRHAHNRERVRVLPSVWMLPHRHSHIVRTTATSPDCDLVRSKRVLLLEVVWLLWHAAVSHGATTTVKPSNAGLDP